MGYSVVDITGIEVGVGARRGSYEPRGPF